MEKCGAIARSKGEQRISSFNENILFHFYDGALYNELPIQFPIKPKCHSFCLLNNVSVHSGYNVFGVTKGGRCLGSGDAYKLFTEHSNTAGPGKDCLYEKGNDLPKYHTIPPHPHLLI